MKNSKALFYCSLVVVCLLIISMLSCKDSDTGTTGGTTALTQANAPEAVAGMILARDPVFFAEEFLDLDIMNYLSVMTSPQTHYFTAGNLIYKGLTLGRRSSSIGPLADNGPLYTSESCSGGGTMEISISWDGPSEPVDPSEMANLQLSVECSNCTEDSVTMDGLMDIEFEGSLVDFSEVSIYLDMTFEDPYENIDVTMDDFSMVMTGNFFSESVSYLADGSVSGSFDGESISIEYDDFLLDLSMVNEDVYMSVSGSVNPPCLNTWLTVTTNSPIIIGTYDDCPIDGDVSLSSGGDTARAVFQSNYEIDIYYNGTLVDTLNSCEDLDGMCTM